MKKLYRRGTVHPSPPPVSSDALSFLPAALITLATALSPEDREVLAYLISVSSNNSSVFIGSGAQSSSSGKKICLESSAGGQRGHEPRFTCDCFSCYMRYWVRWDSSPNRQLIHEILDAFEEGLAQRKQGKKQRRRRELKRAESRKDEGESSELDSVEASSGGEGGGEDGGGEKGSVRRIVSFIGEKIWGVWGA